MATALAQVLTALGHEPVLAGSAAEALELAESGEFDLATVDLFLPDGDGCAVCALLRVEQAVPVIMVSSMGEDLATDLLSADFGPQSILPKPPDAAALGEAIARLLTTEPA
jgi:DNA-binding response OmpR family regulator